MILLNYYLRLAVAYVFEKRNRSPVPAIMASLIFLSPSREVVPADGTFESLPPIRSYGGPADRNI